ncbi:MAG: right-handed parallel beta-helix repeat-containing protein, partial [Candidatus Bathyarchaeota archaeon]
MSKLRKKIVLISVLMLVFSIALGIHPITRVEADSTLYISTDFTFTEDIYEPIVVTADNIVIDGDGFSLLGPGPGYYGFHLDGRTNVTIKNVEIKNWERGINLESSSGNSISGNNVTNNVHGIRLGSSSGNNLFGNNITENYGNGIILHYSSSNSISGNNITYTDSFYGMYFRYSSSNSISGNNISANRWGVVVDYSSNNNFTGNNITSNIVHGIVVRYDSADHILSGNNIINNGAGGIELYYSSGHNISGNYITGNNGGITVDGSPDNLITENNIIANGGGLGIKFTSNNFVSGNNISYNSAQGINIAYSSGDSIYENSIENNQYGIWIHHSSSQSISGNNITENFYHGVIFEDSSGMNLSGNNLSQNGNAVSIYNSTSSSISANNITENNNDGVYLHELSSDNNVSGNNIESNERFGIFISSSSDNSISENSVTQNDLGVYLAGASSNNVCGNNIAVNERWGIYLWSSPGNSIFGNEILENGDYGIRLYSSQNNVIYHNNIIDNTLQVYDDSPADNDWHHPDLLEGNYWSDYPGVDDGSGTGKHAVAGDGIGDTEIPWPGTDYDYYPFVDKTPPIITIVSPMEYGIYPADSGEKYDFNAVDNVDPDPDILAILTDFHGQAVEVDSGELLPSLSGVYTLTVTATDYMGNIAVEEIEFVVYDSTAGFVTGGGWIDSPEGAYTSDPTLTGKARFIFVAKYMKGASEPDGQTEFVFHVADLNFHSTDYQWLVISGSRAQFKGHGTINGEGEYGFMLTVVDGQLKDNGGGSDMFRIKIWDRSTDVVVYDNQVDVLDDSTDPTTEL